MFLQRKAAPVQQQPQQEEATEVAQPIAEQTDATSQTQQAKKPAEKRKFVQRDLLELDKTLSGMLNLPDVVPDFSMPHDEDDVALESPAKRQKLFHDIHSAQKQQTETKWHDDASEHVQIQVSSHQVQSGTEYEQGLRHLYEKMNPMPKWAEQSAKQDNDEENDECMQLLQLIFQIASIFKTTQSIISSASTLPKSTLAYERLADANSKDMPSMVCNNTRI